jgi:hypothetical protein
MMNSLLAEALLGAVGAQTYFWPPSDDARFALLFNVSHEAPNT